MNVAPRIAYWLSIGFVLILVSAGARSSAQDKHSPPRFEDFSVKDVFHGTPAAPIVPGGGRATVWTRAERKGPNFAGYFTIAEYGCGSDCVGFVIIDVRSGKVYGPPFYDLGMWSPRSKAFGGLEYHLHSSLLIVAGCPEINGGPTEKCGVRYYNWKDDQLVLLTTMDEPGPPQPETKPSDKSKQ